MLAKQPIQLRPVALTAVRSTGESCSSHDPMSLLLGSLCLIELRMCRLKCAVLHLSTCRSLQDGPKKVLYPSESATAHERCSKTPALTRPVILTLVTLQSNVVCVFRLVGPDRMSRDESAGAWAPDLTVTSFICACTLPLEASKLLQCCSLERVLVSSRIPAYQALCLKANPNPNAFASQPQNEWPVSLGQGQVKRAFLPINARTRRGQRCPHHVD